MKRIAPLAGAIVLATAGLLVIRSIAHRERRTNLLGSGIIEAQEVRVSAKIAGRLAEVLVREGEQVTRGQIVARLEHEDIDAEVERAQAAVASARAALQDLERGSRPEQIAAARAQLAEAIAARRGAEKQAATARENMRKVTELKQAVDEARARSQAAQARVAQAEARLDEARRGPTEDEIETLRAALAQADARVDAARTALANAEAVYAHQTAIEGPLIAAATEEAALRATTELARREAARTEGLAKADAATTQALDRANTERAVSEARLAGATRGLKDAQEQTELTRAQAKQMRDAAQAALDDALRARDVAQAKLNVALAGTREEGIRLAEAALRAAQAEAEGAQAAFENATTAYTDRLLARQQCDAAETALQRAIASEQAARAQLDLLLAGHTREAIEVARGRLQEAQAALRSAEVRRAYCEIRSPASGTVTETILEEGEMASPGAAIMVVSDLRNLWLRAYVGFTTLGAIAEGQRLEVVTEAVPGQVFEGRVIRISDEAEFTPKDVQTPDQRIRQVYWIKVGLGDARGLLKPGMPADLRLPAR